jgi:hypothetical protein
MKKLALFLMDVKKNFIQTTIDNDLFKKTFSF